MKNDEPIFVANIVLTRSGLWTGLGLLGLLGIYIGAKKKKANKENKKENK